MRANVGQTLSSVNPRSQHSLHYGRGTPRRHHRKGVISAKAQNHPVTEPEGEDNIYPARIGPEYRVLTLWSDYAERLAALRFPCKLIPANPVCARLGNVARSIESKRQASSV